MQKTLNLKKGIAFVIAMIMICIAFASVVVINNHNKSAIAADGDTIITLQIDNPDMTVNGQTKEIDPGAGTTPVVVDERTLVPVRAIIEAVGGTVDWDQDTETATLAYNGDVIRLTIGSTTAYLNDEASELDVTPVIINERTMLPIRFIAEGFKFTVDWDQDTQTVTITVPASDAEQKTTLVVYYSATENTHRVANYIAAASDADTFRLEAVEPYTDADLTWTDDNSRVVREHENPDEQNKVELVETTVPNWDSYDTVFIGYPIWWGNAAWPLNGFIEANDFTGKTVIPFCTSSSSGLGESGKLLAEAAGTGNWLEGKRFSESAQESEVREWVESLNITVGTTTTADAPVVYMTTDITPEALVEIYNMLDFTLEGNVAVKMSTGEPPNSNYLRPELIKDLVQSVNGTIVESNTAYGGQRAESAKHWQVIKDHGFLDIAEADILDEDGSLEIPVNVESATITENYVGAHLENYDSLISLAHFKGHAMAGYGGAIKNMSIGIASAEGKNYIHTGGVSRTSWMGGDQDAFLEAMGDATSAVVDFFDGKVVYVNVMNRLSVDCDCSGNPSEPDIHDIGILASYDPVALDQACLDLIYAQKDGDGASLVNRIESRNGLHTLEHAEQIGLGSRAYNLISIDS